MSKKLVVTNDFKCILNGGGIEKKSYPFHEPDYNMYS